MRQMPGIGRPNSSAGSFTAQRCRHGRPTRADSAESTVAAGCQVQICGLAGLRYRPSLVVNRQIVITDVPVGALGPEHFAERDVEMPTLGPDQVTVRTKAITIGAGQRAGLQGSTSYAGAAQADVVMGVVLGA